MVCSLSLQNELALPILVHKEPKQSTLCNDIKRWCIQRKLIFQVFLFTSMWWLSAVTVVIEISKTVGPEGIFPHPFALTAILQPTTALCAFLLAKLLYAKNLVLPQLTQYEVKILVLLGVLQGVEVGLTNKALEFLSVATRTMVSSTNVLFMMATAWSWGLERLGHLRVLAAGLLIAGSVFQGVGQSNVDSSFCWSGLCLQVGAMLTGCQRWALTQHVLQHSPPDSALARTPKLYLMMRTLPVTGLVCLPLAQVFEPDAFTAGQLGTELILRIAATSAALAAMLYSEFKLVHLLSAVAFQVLSTVHQVPVILAGTILQHNQVDVMSWYGFTFCLAGAITYALARSWDPPKLVAAPKASTDAVPRAGR